MQFLQLLDVIIANINETNVSEFVSLVENLASLAESVFKHQQAANVSPVNTTPVPVVATEPSIVEVSRSVA